MATQLFLRNTASSLGGAGQKALALTRGAASTTAVTTSTASGTNIVVTQTAGGQQLTWYSDPLNAQSISGTIDVNIRGREAAIAANAGAGVLVERVNSAGVVQSTILSDRTVPASITEYTTTDAAKTSTGLAITATTFAINDRVKVTLKVRNVGTMGSGSVTNTYDGPSAAAGDTYVTFSANLTWAPVAKSGSDTASVAEFATLTGTGIPEPPTFPDRVNLAIGTGTRTLPAVTTQPGDWLVCEIVFEAVLAADPTLSPLTWTEQNDAEAGLHAEVWQYTTQDATGGSRAIQIAGITGNYAANLTVVRGSDGPGTGTGTSTAAQTRSVTRQGHNSAMFMTVGDWDAGDPGTPVWTPGGATTYVERNSVAVTVIFGRLDNAGMAATEAHGISTPFIGTPSIAVLEMLGQVAGGGGEPTPIEGSDTAAGTDGTATLSTALTPATDARTAAEVSTVGATLTPAADARTGLDAGTLGATLTPATDLRTLVDAGTLLASFSGSELGGSLDAPSGPLSATLASADTGGVGTEAYQLVVTLQSDETGSQADAGTVEQGAIAKAGSDTTTATDAATLGTSHTRADTGSTSDVATLVVSITGADLRSIVDTVLALAAAHQRADTASTVEGYSLLAGGNQFSGEASSTAEAGTLAIQLAGSDSGLATENQSVVQGQSKSASDTGSATEIRSLAIQLTASEIVTVVEAVLAHAAGGNPAGGDASAVGEQIQLAVQVTGTDGATSVDQAAITLAKVGTDSSVLVDNAQLLAQLTVNEIYAAVEVLAVLTGPQTWKFVSADVRSIPIAGYESTSSRLLGITGGTRIDISVTW